MINTTFLTHIAVAALLGGVIGLERGYRAKEAGFRTHFLVALGAALFMILSAHGFDGALVTENHRLDVSRIAAQVVSGIGFIGAGTIIFQRQTVHGLTTAAGLWVTAAIGMAAGAGMYVLAAAATILVLLCLEAMNFILHRFGAKNMLVTFIMPERSALQPLLRSMKNDGIGVTSCEMREKHDGQCEVTLEMTVKRDKYDAQLVDLMDRFEGMVIERME